jgi:hypothetical protein
MHPKLKMMKAGYSWFKKVFEMAFKRSAIFFNE